MSTIGVTGHQRLDHDEEVIKAWTGERLRVALQSGFTHLISGMAIGYDIIAAEVALELGFKVWGAIPFRNQVLRYSDHWKIRYLNVYDQICDKQGGWKIIGGAEKSPGCYQRRNIWICEKSRKILAYYNGAPRGGTHHTVTHARQLGREVELFPYGTKEGRS